MKSPLTRRRFLGATAATSAAGLVGAAPSAGAAAAQRGPRSAPSDAAHPGRASRKGTRLTLLGTSGGPPPDYVRTGMSSALTVEGRNYVVDAGRSSVTQYLNAGLLFNAAGGDLHHPPARRPHRRLLQLLPPRRQRHQRLERQPRRPGARPWAGIRRRAAAARPASGADRRARRARAGHQPADARS